MCFLYITQSSQVDLEALLPPLPFHGDHQWFSPWVKLFHTWNDLSLFFFSLVYIAKLVSHSTYFSLSPVDGVYAFTGSLSHWGDPTCIIHTWTQSSSFRQCGHISPPAGMVKFSNNNYLVHCDKVYAHTSRNKQTTSGHYLHLLLLNTPSWSLFCVL